MSETGGRHGRDLRARASERLRSGALSRDGGRVFGQDADGRAQCALCSSPIPAGGVQIIEEASDAHYFHVHCHALIVEARAQLETR